MSGLTGLAGWGAGSWGGTPWGGASLGVLRLVDAVATRENVIRLQFTRPVYWSGILDIHDASIVSNYAVTAIPGSVGLDGSPARPVMVVMVVPRVDDLPEGSAAGSYLDLTTDRPMTAYPALYAVSATALVSSDLATPLTSPTLFQFYGAFKQVVVPDVSAPHPSRDIANPQTLTALVDSYPNTMSGSAANGALAVFNADDTGDYAFDSGMVALKKRIFRRLVTVPGGFAHLGNGYGVGVTLEGKKLALAATLGRIASSAEAQISKEPEVARVSVRARSRNDGIVRLEILVRTRAGGSAKWFADLPTK